MRRESVAWLSKQARLGGPLPPERRCVYPVAIQLSRPYFAMAGNQCSGGG